MGNQLPVNQRVQWQSAAGGGTSKVLAETLSAFASGWRSWALGPLPGYLWKNCAQLQWPTVNGRTIARAGFPVTVGRQTRIFFASG